MRPLKVKKQSINLQPSPVSRACLTAVMMIGGAAIAPNAFAGAGWGDSNGPDGAPIRVRTYYAHTPSGQRDVIPVDNTGNPAANNNGGFTGTALRKFVDALPMLGKSATTLADGVTSKYIPKAVPAKWVRPDGSVSNDDYYELAVIQYKEKLHSDLKPTTLRGYVQLTKDSANGYALTYPDGSPIQIQDTDASGFLLWLDDAKTQPKMVQAYATDKPHYLGPAIVAQKGVATRVKVYNLLPTGRYDAAAGARGDLFIPVDETLPGAGVGPNGVTRYTQNRASLHLHGGDTPWISDGTPHQWFAPAAEEPLLISEIAAAGGNPADVSNFMRGASAANVPDMPEPGKGNATFYFPNGQSARMLWYHDHTFGLTRLNVYAGMASTYDLQDVVQGSMLSAIAGFPGEADTIPLVIQDKTFVPDDIALQDGRWNFDAKGVPLDGKNGNAAPVWGQPGDVWYPHVYEVNQDPSNGVDGTNPVGRWDWGPYFWPVFPSLYNLPTGAVGDVTITPEAWMDTPLVNGVAYPTLSLDPKPYRFKILNAANDRMWNLGMFVADSAVSEIKVLNGGSGYDPATTTVTLVKKPGANGDGATAQAVVDAVTGAVTAIRVTAAGSGYNKTPNIFITDKNGNKTAVAMAVLAENTEVHMVPAVPQASSGLPACAVDANGNDIAAPYAPPCWPSSWPTDGRDGGVPDPATAGPTFFQIGNEGGLLPQVAEVAAAPMAYEYNRRSITVLNTWSNGLFLGNAERADVVVDLSNFAGQTLIVYNDSPAPVPAFDPRNDHWTGKPDETGAGSVETPRAGYGPNTRTVMQIKVADKTPQATLDLAALKAKLPDIYSATQEAPVVAQAQYSAAFKQNWTDAPQADGTKSFATIFTGSLQEPAFKFTPGSGAGSFRIKVDNGGLGYITSPAVTLSAPNAATGAKVQATATAMLKVANVAVLNGGAGYQYAPAVTFVSNGNGSGANATAWMKVNSVTGLTGGAGYLNGGSGTVKLMFSAPQRDTQTAAAPFDKAANTAYGMATIVNGAITGFTVTFPGTGYTMLPLLSPVPADGSPAPTTYPTPGVVDLAIDNIQMVSSDPNHPEFAGGAGYNDMRTVAVTISAPTGATRRAATTRLVGAVGDITLVNNGQGYDTAPTVTVAAPPVAVGNVAAAASAVAGGSSILVKNKAIQELFDPTYGRMNATLGVEIPFTSALTQTTIPLGYVDPVSEEFNDGETQIWKITHNGVDTHPVHFHLLNVQVINRVGWDGTIKPPKPNEYGWKETIKMNPLEDILVAVRAKKPTLPGFGVPLSQRMRDPSQPANVPMGFTQIDVKTGLPATIVNQMDNYGWEYVWHCHILGHEENDFMRPVKFNANEAIPTAPTNVVSSQTSAGKTTLSWTDTSSTEYQFRIERFPLDANGVVIPTTALNNPPAFALANSQSYVDTLPANFPNVASSIQFKVIAVGANGEAASNSTTGVVISAPVNFAGTLGSNGTIALSWTAGPAQIGQYLLRSSLNGAAYVDVATLPKTAGTNTTSFTPASVTAGDSYTFQLIAQSVTNGLVTAASTPSTTVSPFVYNAPATPAGMTTALNTNGSITVNWTEATAGVTQFLVQPKLNGVALGAPVTVNALSYTFLPSNVAAGQAYSFDVTAQQVIGASTLSSGIATSGAVTYAAPINTGTPTVTLNNITGIATVNWTAVNNATQYAVQPMLGGVAVGSPIVVAGGTTTSTTFTPASVTAGDVYTFNVKAQQVINGTALSASGVTSVSSVTYTAPSAVTAVTLTVNSSGVINVRWTGGAGATQFLVTPSAGGLATTVGASPLAFTPSPLSAGTYNFQVTAQKKYSAIPSVLSATAVGNSIVLAAPNAPTINAAAASTFTTLTGTTNSMTVAWAAPAAGTPPVQSYTVTIVDANGATVGTGSATAAGTLTITGLPRYRTGTTLNTYTATVTAVNAVGSTTSAGLARAAK